MSRLNAHNDGDLIEEPSGILEDIIRTYLHSERDLVIKSIISSDTISIDNLIGYNRTNYYVGSIVHNIDKNTHYPVLSSQTDQVQIDTSVSWDAGDNIIITNINSNIDTDSFDLIGAGVLDSGTNTSVSSYKLICSGKSFTTSIFKGLKIENTSTGETSFITNIDSNTQLSLENDIFTSGSQTFEIYGLRHNHKFRRSIDIVLSPNELVRQLCYEANLILVNPFNKYKVVAVEDGIVSGTLSKPKIFDGDVQIFPYLSPIKDVFTEFEVNYGYSYEKNKYTKKIEVNKKYSSNSNLDSYKEVCKNSEYNYRIRRKFVYNCDWIYDDFTAEEFTRMKIEQLSFQRLYIDYTGDIENHIQYEEGDRVLLDYSFMIPIGVNATKSFMVVGSRISFKKKAVKLSLLY